MTDPASKEDKRKERRAHYRYFMSIPTRWMDNDMLGHVNNVTYYRFFEAIVVRFSMDVGRLDWHGDPVIPYAVESMCRYWRPVSYPETVEAGLRVGRMGNSSITYEIALFTEGADEPAATGHFVHVFIDRRTE
ncbi:MAG: acyl-CoA thioesterase, partial [Alphaproteobacteria bacterium]|nr:acyl-CoA thioesterase [Alphaproteobacteria bacterium]